MLQDPSHRHEPSPSSRSDLGEVVSEVTDSQANRPLMQDSTDPDDSLSSAKSGLVEAAEVEEAMESEAVRLLAARIPPELFDDILFYVNVDRASRRHGKYEWGKSLQRNRGESSRNDVLTHLKRCSLVCPFWANKCREHMFSDRTLWIESYEDAEIFRRYIVAGCPRLTPVHQLISEITLRQDYESRTSFLHLLHLPAIQDKLKRLYIHGPVPEGFNPAKLDTPHWGIPPYTVVPSSFLPNRVFPTNVQFPSFYHIIKYIRHLCHATFIRFEKITWDEQMTLALPHVSSTIACQRRPRSLGIEVLGGCTNSLHLTLTALMMNPNCPLHRLSSEELVWMMKFMTLLWGDVPNPDVRIEFDVSEQMTTMCAGPFHFVFEEAPATHTSTTSLSVVGMHAYIDEFYGRGLPDNFDALVNHARTHPTIRALVLLFDSIDHLQKSVKPFAEVLGPATEALDLVLAYEEEEEKGEEEQHWGRKKTGRVLGVDPVTIEPTEPEGHIWADLPGPWGEDRSFEMLRRELKKRH